MQVKVSLRENASHPCVCFAVEDTGIGIPKNRQEAIFESFTQGDGHTSRLYGGTGLGLAVTKQRTELLGGELTLSSEPGKGSVFSLTVPTGVDAAEQSPLEPHFALAQEGDESDTVVFSGKVLVAEDVETNRVLMELILSKMGIEVCLAEDGNQAVQKALSQPFDLIFMDMQMPHMNGYQATRALRQQGISTPMPSRA